MIIEVVCLGSWEIRKIKEEKVYFEIKEKFRVGDYLLGINYSEGSYEVFRVTKTEIKRRKIAIRKNSFVFKNIPNEYFNPHFSFTEGFSFDRNNYRKMVRFLLKYVKQDFNICYYKRNKKKSFLDQDLFLSMSDLSQISNQEDRGYERSLIKRNYNMFKYIIVIVNMSFVLEELVIQFCKGDRELQKLLAENLKEVEKSEWSKLDNSFLLDSPIGIGVEKNAIILTASSSFSITIDFFFFWGILRTLLSATIIPIFIIMFLDNIKGKSICYILLGMVTAISYVFENEKWLSEIRKKNRVSLATLFFWGIFFVIYSLVTCFQILIKWINIDSWTDLFMNALANILISYGILFILIFLVTSINCLVIILQRKNIISKIKQTLKTPLIKLTVYLFCFFCYSLLYYDPDKFQKDESSEFLCFVGISILTFVLVSNEVSKLFRKEKK